MRKDGRKPVLRLFCLCALLLGLVAVGCGPAPDDSVLSEDAMLPEQSPPSAAQISAEIVEMLESSARSWNAGDLDGFMDDYWNDPNLTFSGSTGVTRGWEDVRQRYLRTHWAPGAARDSLRFEDIEVRPLGESHALALGRYVLYQPETDTVTATGFFSLVLCKSAQEWRIVHDHTSAEEPTEGS